MKAAIVGTVLTLLALVTSVAWAHAELGPSNFGSLQAETHKFLEHRNDILTDTLDIANYYSKVMEQPSHVANQFLENSEGNAQ